MALHWVAKEEQFTKSHQLLKPGGYLALLSNEPVSDEAGDKFYKALGLITGRYGWERKVGVDYERLPMPADLYNFRTRPPIDNNLFDEVDRAVFTLDLEPRTGLDHAMYMHTLARVLAMPETERMAFLREVKDLIETEFNDRLDYRYATMLVVARKK